MKKLLKYPVIGSGLLTAGVTTDVDGKAIMPNLFYEVKTEDYTPATTECIWLPVSEAVNMMIEAAAKDKATTLPRDEPRSNTVNP